MVTSDERKVLNALDAVRMRKRTGIDADEFHEYITSHEIAREAGMSHREVSMIITAMVDRGSALGPATADHGPEGIEYSFI